MQSHLDKRSIYTGSFVEIISNFVVLFFDKCRGGEFGILELNFRCTKVQTGNRNLIYFQINFISTEVLIKGLVIKQKFNVKN